MSEKNPLTLRLADQARSDFAAIDCDLQFIMAQIARIPTRKEQARNALGIIFATAMLTTLDLAITCRRSWLTRARTVASSRARLYSACSRGRCCCRPCLVLPLAARSTITAVLQKQPDSLQARRLCRRRPARCSPQPLSLGRLWPLNGHRDRSAISAGPAWPASAHRVPSAAAFPLSALRSSL